MESSDRFDLFFVVPAEAQSTARNSWEQESSWGEEDRGAGETTRQAPRRFKQRAWRGWAANG